MEIWISIIGLGVTTLSIVIAAAILYGKLQQRVTELERDVAGHNAWKDSTVLQVAQMGQVPEELRGIKSALADLRAALSRFEGYQEAARERDRDRDRIPRRDTLPP